MFMPTGLDLLAMGIDSGEKSKTKSKCVKDDKTVGDDDEDCDDKVTMDW